MAVEIITSFDQQCDSSGDPMSGAKIYVYNVGTTTLRDVFSDTGLTPPAAANPIICDSAGRHDMRYTATGSYKIVVKTSADVTVYTRDNIDGRVPVGSGALAIANGGTGSTTAGAALSALGAATASELADLSAEVASISGSLASTEKTHIATGTTAQRPASPVDGDIRRNTTIPQWEGYEGAASAWRYFVTETSVGTSGAKFGLLNANKTDSGTNTFSAVNTFSSSSGIPARNTVKAFGAVTTGTLDTGSFNIASVTDGGTHHVIAFTTAMTTATYTVLVTHGESGTGNTITVRYNTRATGSFRVDAINQQTGNLQDPGTYSFMVLENA